MKLFRSRKNNEATAVAERRPESVEAEQLTENGEYRAAIDLLAAANKSERDVELERQIRRVRHLAGIELMSSAPDSPSFPEASSPAPAIDPVSKVPEVQPHELTPEVLRAAILQSGCLLVRGMMDPVKAEALAQDIDHSFEVRKGLAPGEVDPDGFYEELQPEDSHVIGERGWIEQGGGVLAADSPRMLFDMLDAFETANLPSVIEGYLGETPALSAQKCTLRKATPDVKGAWHQDGKFLGDVRAMNVWLSLSRCGDVAPGMDIVPTRLEHFAQAGTDDAPLDYVISDAEVARAAGDTGVVRPIFNPGDALLFDDLFLHQTGSDDDMPNPRYAIESWFFGPSAFPDGYVPIAI